MKNNKAQPVIHTPSMKEWKMLSFQAIAAAVADKLHVLSDLVESKNRTPEEDQALAESLVQIMRPIATFIQSVEVIGSEHVALYYRPSRRVLAALRGMNDRSFIIPKRN